MEEEDQAAVAGERTVDKKQKSSGKMPRKKALNPSNSGNITITVQPDLFDCPVCCEPLKPPIHQCVQGHILCSSCVDEFTDCCYVRYCRSSFYFRCLAMEMAIDSMKTACPNARYGCKELLPFMQRNIHQDVCGYAQCFCPEPSCRFSGTEKQLTAHFRDSHKGSGPEDAQFLYGRPFRISLPRTKPCLVVQAPDGVLFFILNDTSRSDGNAISLSCISQILGKLEFSYLLCVDYAGSLLRLNGAARGVRRWWDEAQSTEASLVIPRGFFAPPAQEAILELSVWNWNPIYGGVPSSPSPTVIEDDNGIGDGGSITVIIDPDMLDCPVCFQRLSPPIYQCEKGHFWCSPCFWKNCYLCPDDTDNALCLAFEAIIYSANNPSGGNASPGINNSPEDATCFCPEPSCSFSGTEKRLAVHFRASHKDSGAVEFVYGLPLQVSLPRAKPNMVLQAPDGLLFLLHNTCRPDGNAVSLSCIRRPSAGGKLLLLLSYTLRAVSTFVDELSFGADVRSVASWDEAEHPSEVFLLIPRCLFSPEEVSLEVYIWKSKLEKIL